MQFTGLAMALDQQCVCMAFVFVRPSLTLRETTLGGEPTQGGEPILGLWASVRLCPAPLAFKGKALLGAACVRTRAPHMASIRCCRRWTRVDGLIV
jgi:hypothetical protein